MESLKNNLKNLAPKKITKALKTLSKEKIKARTKKIGLGVYLAYRLIFKSPQAYAVEETNQNNHTMIVNEHTRYKEGFKASEIRSTDKSESSSIGESEKKQNSGENLKPIRSEAYIKAKNLRALRRIGLKIEANAKEEELQRLIRESVRKYMYPPLFSRPGGSSQEPVRKEFNYFSKQFEGMDEKDFNPNAHLGIPDNLEESFNEFPYEFDPLLDEDEPKK